MPARNPRREIPLPIAGQPEERSDARRNRRRILGAAAELVAERGLAAVKMEEIAARAGVAKGTVFQRFGSRAGLAVALVDESERVLQDALLRGPPPLGPGAPAPARLVAFLETLLELTERNLQLLLISDYDAAGARYRTGVYGAWHHHVAVLIREAGLGAQASGLAHVLLAPLAADLIHHRLHEEGTALSEIGRELRVLAIALVDVA